MRKFAFVLIVVYVLGYVLPSGVRPLMAPDELRYAEQAREVVASGDWIVPRLGGVRYFEKPLLATWLNAVSLMVLGDNAFAARLPSVIAVGLTALMLFWLVRSVTGDDEAAVLTALIYVTFLQVFAVGTFVVVDSVLTLWITMALVAFHMAHQESERARRWLGLATFGAMCGAAFLTKGFLAFVVAGVVIVPFLVWERRWKEVFTRPWLPAIVALVVALPWSVAIAWHEPDFWHYFGWIEHVQRFMSSPASQHPEPPWYFFHVIIGGSLPWTILAPRAIVDLVRSQTNRSLVRFAACWLVMPFLFFSASSGKLGTYIQPCYPPLAILIALGLVRGLRQAEPRRFKAGIIVMASLTGAGLLWLLFSQVIGRAVERGSGVNLEWVVLATAMFVWTAVLLLSLRVRDPATRMALYSIGPVALFLAVPVSVSLGVTSPRLTPVAAVERHSAWADQGTVIVTEADLVTSIGWAYGRSNLYVLEPAGELTYGFEYDDANHRLIAPASLAGFIESRRQKHDVVLILWEESDLGFDLPPATQDETDREVRFVLFRSDAHEAATRRLMHRSESRREHFEEVSIRSSSLVVGLRRAEWTSGYRVPNDRTHGAVNLDDERK